MASYAAGFLLLLSSLCALAQPEAGRDYLPIIQVQQPQGDKIELVEFFYYGCPQCFELEPILQDWLERRRDIKIVRIPAFRSSWLALAKAYYALEIMGQEDRLRRRIFSALHDGMDLINERVLFDWIEKQGIDRKKFESVYFSSAVANKIDDSEKKARRLGISGVPSLVVDGRYLVLGNLARTDILDQLVAMAGKERISQPLQ
ncbi:MAG: thiol:disulfide interchange protein DsbA/DsbL [Burkholderiales bacterium]|nr:thiol:disulfide interchange protein DsbA/DsbL [Burkholderiales bacterium]